MLSGKERNHKINIAFSPLSLAAYIELGHPVQGIQSIEKEGSLVHWFIAPSFVSFAPRPKKLQSALACLKRNTNLNTPKCF